MGYLSEFNWVLKLKSDQGLDESNLESGKIYSFNKSGKRNYPLGFPIILVNNDWEAVGNVDIINFTNDGIDTKGNFKIIKIYNGVEKEVLTNFLREGLSYYKNEKIEDYSKTKAT